MSIVPGKPLGKKRNMPGHTTEQSVFLDQLERFSDWSFFIKKIIINGKGEKMFGVDMLILTY